MGILRLSVAIIPSVLRIKHFVPLPTPGAGDLEVALTAGWSVATVASSRHTPLTTWHAFIFLLTLLVRLLRESLEGSHSLNRPAHRYVHTWRNRAKEPEVERIETDQG